jgi:hypothetical protein
MTHDNPADGHEVVAGPTQVAEQRVLPAAEAVEGHRHRDRDVDPIMPTWTSFWNLRAAATLTVKMAVPLP